MMEISAPTAQRPGHPDLEGFPELSLALKTEKARSDAGCSQQSRRNYPCDQKYLGTNIELVEGEFHLLPYDGGYISKLARQ